MCKFQPIDMQTWPMAQAFYYYTQMAPTGYTVNVNMDVTILRKELKARGYKFFPAYIYLVSKGSGVKSPQFKLCFVNLHSQDIEM